MPIHDWTRVEAGNFHDFHLEWISTIKESLNGLLPPDYYAMAEQQAGGFGPDVLTLKGPTGGRPMMDSPAGVALATSPPRVQFRARTEADIYTGKARRITVRHTSNHRVIAVVEIVSPGNKNSRHGLLSFVEKAGEFLRRGVHLLVLDLFPTSNRDPQGIHQGIWDEVTNNDFTLPAGRPLTLASYIGGPIPEAFVEPTAVGETLADMPLFLSPEIYVPVPLEATYLAAWAKVPAIWRDFMSQPRP